MVDENVNIRIAAAANEAITSLQSLNNELGNLTNKQKDNATATQAATVAHGQNVTAMVAAKQTISSVVQELTGMSMGMLTAAGAATALVGEIRKSIDADVQLGTETRNMSLLIGANSEESSKLIAVSGDLGVSYEALTRGMEAAIRKGYQPTIDGLSKMGAEYRSIQDPIARSKYLMDTFGRSGADLAPILEASKQKLDDLASSAQAAGVVMDSEGVRRTRDYKLSLNELNDAFTGLEVRIGDKVLPELTKIIKGTENAITATRNWTQELKNNAAAADAGSLAMHGYISQAQANTIVMQAEYTQQVQNTQSTEDFRKADEAASAAVSTSTATIESNKQAAKDLSMEMNALSDKTLFTLAEKTITNTQEQQNLAIAMGMVNSSSIAAQNEIDKWTAMVDAGSMTREQFASQVADIANGLNNIKSKSVTIDVTENIRINESHYLSRTDVAATQENAIINAGQTGAAAANAGVGANDPRSRSTAPTGGRGQYFGEGQSTIPGRAIGGAGYGWTRVGENGPEVVNLPLGSQVVNNYNTNYNLTAHYPGYQDPNAARNDLIALTLLKNAGASKWA